MIIVGKPRTCFRLLDHLNLGDIINSVQMTTEYAKSNPERDYFIYSDSKEKAYSAKVDPKVTLREVLSIMDTPLRYLATLPEEANYLVVRPQWTDKFGEIDFLKPMKKYQLAKNLPEEKGDHITIQTNSRSWGQLGIIQEEEQEFAEAIRDFKAINLGDRQIEGAEYQGDATLKEKLNYIATAKAHLGVNSGMTHLALMTNTPIVMMQDRHWWWTQCAFVGYGDSVMRAKTISEAAELVRRICSD